MKTSLNTGLLSVGVLVLSCCLNSSTYAADQVQTPSGSNTGKPATPLATTHKMGTNLVTSTRVKSAQDEQPFTVTLESPIDQAVEIGGTALFSIYCAWPDAVFQWLFQCDRIQNATNSTLVVSKLSFEDAGYYTCVVYRGFDFELSKPMQLLVFQRNEEGIKVAAKAPPGLGGMWDVPIKGEKPRAQLENLTPTSLESAVAMQAAGGRGTAGIASLGSSLMTLAQMTLFMYSTNAVTGATVVSVMGTGCPRPYQGYVRFTAGWYPNGAAQTWKVYGAGGPSVYSAMTFDDTTRQGCNAGNIFDLTNYAPLRLDKPHRFVCFFSTPPSPTATYVIQLVGFL